MVDQWLLVYNSSPSPDYFIHKCQDLSLLFTGRKMLSGCMEVPSLKDIVVVLKNFGKGLRRPGIVWLHLLKCQIGGVQQVFMITPSCLL